MATIIVTKPSEAALAELGVRRWPVWACEVSRFEWHYDEKETGYFLAGQVEVTTAEESITIGKGDLVIFPAGLDCTWNVTAPVKKHYKMG